MGIIRLAPAFKEYIWGGHKLQSRYNKANGGASLAESWELSCNPAGLSIIAEGPCQGMALADLLRENPSFAGGNCAGFKNFPVLVKFIDAQAPLSIQVHPDDSYALKQENQYGKTEIWHIMDTEPGAYIYLGFSRSVDKTEYRRLITDGRLTEVLNKIFVQSGETYFIPAGTVHAVGPGILLAEIQQNSDVTYRIFDYNRTDKNGNTRELHIEKALDVTIREAVNIPDISTNKADFSYACDYFSSKLLPVHGAYTGSATCDSFHHLLITNGCGMVSGNNTATAFSAGESFFIPAGFGAYEINGTCAVIKTVIPKR